MWSREVRAEGTVHYPGGDGQQAPIDPDDVGAVAAATMTSDAHLNQGYELTGPELMTFGDMVNVLARVLARELRYVDGVEYSTTALGATLSDPLGALYEWANVHLPEAADAQRRFDARVSADARG